MALLRAALAVLLVAVAFAGCGEAPAQACKPQESAVRAQGGGAVVEQAVQSRSADGMAVFSWDDPAYEVCTDKAASALVILTVADVTHADVGGKSCDPLGVQASARVSFGESNAHGFDVPLTKVQDQGRTGFTGTAMVPLQEAYAKGARGSYGVILTATFPSKGGEDADLACATAAFVNLDLTDTYVGKPRSTP